ncbi:MAG: tRNA modification GTPase [Phycisphaerales bacterium JB059]
MPVPGTIAAIASAPGPAPRALIRLAGPETSRALGALGLADPRRRSARPVRLRLDDRRTLPALLLRFVAPDTFTGEDAAELLITGNPRLGERLLAQLLRVEGVRLAEPGEFSARAYLAGRLTLAQAEGVAALISARTEAHLRAANNLLSGQTGATYRDWSERLATLLALVEGGIDFTDQEDVTPIPPGDLVARLERIRAEIDAYLGPDRPRESLDHAPLAVLVGEPNAGKATLFNALLGRERAVTHDAPGVTRDVLIEPLDPALPGAPPVRLADLPGLDATATAGRDLDAQRQAHEAIARADLLVQCDPTGRFPPIEHAPPGAPVIRVRTQADRPGDRPSGAISVCALDGYHLDALRRALADAPLGVSPSVLPRHGAELARALDALDEAIGVAPLGELELTAAPMRTALDALGELTGEISPDEVIGRVFATFCVGK